MFDRAGDDEFYDRKENRPASSSRKRTTEAQNLSGAQRWSQSGPSPNTKKAPVVIDSDREEVDMDEDEGRNSILSSDRARKRRATPSKAALGMESDDERKPSPSGSKSARKKQAVKQVMGDGGDSVGAGARLGKEREGRKGGSAGGKSTGRGVIPLLKYGGMRSLPGPKTLNPKP